MANTNFKPWLGSAASTDQQAYYTGLVNAQTDGFQPRALIKAQDFNAILRMTTLVCAGIVGVYNLDGLTIDASEDAVTAAIKNYELPTLKVNALTAKSLTVNNLTVSDTGTFTAAGNTQFNSSTNIDFNTLPDNGSGMATRIKEPGLYIVGVSSAVDGTLGTSVILMFNVTQNDFFKKQITSTSAILSITGLETHRSCYAIGERNDTNTFDLRFYYISNAGQETMFIPKDVRIYKLGDSLKNSLYVGYVQGVYNWQSALGSGGKNLPDNTGNFTSLDFCCGRTDSISIGEGNDDVQPDFIGIRWDEDNRQLIYKDYDNETVIAYSAGEGEETGAWTDETFRIINFGITGQEISSDWQDFIFEKTIRT